MTEVLFVLGGSVFAAMGLLHALYTLWDTRHPRRLVPDDPAVIEAMRASGVRMARGGTTMWRAWIGFNLSHSLGAVVYGACCILVGAASSSLALPGVALVVPVAVGVLLPLGRAAVLVPPAGGRDRAGHDDAVDRGAAPLERDRLPDAAGGFDLENGRDQPGSSSCPASPASPRTRAPRARFSPSPAPGSPRSTSRRT